jgi:hypothetical protein
MQKLFGQPSMVKFIQQGFVFPLQIEVEIIRLSLKSWILYRIKGDWYKTA